MKTKIITKEEFKNRVTNGNVHICGIYNNSEDDFLEMVELSTKENFMKNKTNVEVSMNSERIKVRYSDNDFVLYGLDTADRFSDYVIFGDYTLLFVHFSTRDIKNRILVFGIDKEEKTKSAVEEKQEVKPVIEKTSEAVENASENTDAETEPKKKGRPKKVAEETIVNENNDEQNQ